MKTIGDIVCSVCGDKPPEKGRKTCSACRKKLQRKGSVENISVPRVEVPIGGAVLTYDGTGVSLGTRGHWFGKPPHKAHWTECLAKDCPHANNPKPDWVPTCDRLCCKED